MIVHIAGVADGTVRVAVVGEIDLATVADFEAALATAVAVDGTPRVVVDFREVGFCDSSGIAALDRAYQRAADRGGSLRLTGLQRGVSRLLEVTGMLEPLTRPTG